MSEKVGRNDPCPCGSGKKYKQCCQKLPKAPKFRAKVLSGGRQQLPFLFKQAVKETETKTDTKMQEIIERKKEEKSSDREEK